jgi:hypothetical protein
MPKSRKQSRSKKRMTRRMRGGNGQGLNPAEEELQRITVQIKELQAAHNLAEERGENLKTIEKRIDELIKRGTNILKATNQQGVEQVQISLEKNKNNNTKKNKYNSEEWLQIIAEYQLPNGISQKAAYAAMIIIGLGAYSGALATRCPEEDILVDLAPEINKDNAAFEGVLDLIAFYKAKIEEETGKKAGISGYLTGITSSVGSKVGSFTGFSQILPKEKTLAILRDIKDEERYTISLCDYKYLVNRFYRDIFPNADLSQISRFTRQNRIKNIRNKTMKRVKSFASGVGSVGTKVTKEVIKLPYTTATVVIDLGGALLSALIGR